MVGPAIEALRVEVERVVVGRRSELDAILSALLAGGHAVLEGPPGTAKTLLVRVLAQATGCAFRRVQFTSDLMPSDILGTNVFDPRDSTFRFAPGPVFADVVLADEINRAPAKTQAALLECMEERSVTLDGTVHPLPEGFTVFATMNPIELEGTFPLPEAQLDRFLMKIRVGEIDAAAEREVVARVAAGMDPWALASSGIRRVITSAELAAARAAVRKIAVEEHVQEYLVEIVRRTRKHSAVALGASTRAAVALLSASRARAACSGREFVIPDDVKALAPFVLAHRLSIAPEAQMENVDGYRVIAEILEATPVPRIQAG
jgi:MoxR-like ATPase